MSEKSNVRAYRNKILVFLNKTGKKPLSFKELAKKCRSKKGSDKEFTQAVAELVEKGMIFERKRGFVLSAVLGLIPAKISRINRTFGFAVRNDDKSEIFIPGKYLMGSMPDDDVLIHLIPSRTGSPEGKVVSVLKENSQRLSGMVMEYEHQFYIVPDSMSNNHVKLVKGGDIHFKAGDKVIAEIVKRGSRHSEHIAKVVINFGNSDSAENCSLSILALHGIETEFSQQIRNDAEKLEKAGISSEDTANRLDLRYEPIFTIDSFESKDLDDAVSVHKLSDGGYMLGVHIADVSHYVKGNSNIDKEALNRGTSIYYADKVIPMLPESLSNGICSLNPNEDRLAFSAIMKLTPDGSLKEYTFKKSVICSRVKGIYSEINKILDGTAGDEIREKYAEVMDSIFLMKELADILSVNKDKRGAPQIETSESKIIVKDNVCCDVTARERGISECIIEEFMLMANEACAKFAREKNIPFVYRVHENPDATRIDNLKEVLDRLNIEYPPFSSPKPAHLAQILKNTHDMEIYPVVNVMVLRAMAKAKYMNKPLGHFGLALDDYAHFTSPIRRYPDLAVHRILSDVISGKDIEWLNKRYESFTLNASERSTNAEIKAMTVERECEDCYKAEFMSSKLGMEFGGIISNVTEFGFYVELDNTIEGLVHVNSMPECNLEYDGMMSLKDTISGTTFTAGDRVRILCAKADVNSGNIDFKYVCKTGD